jgi:hypothetical protein
MMQQLIVVLLVGLCVSWLAYQAYRYFRPKPGGKLCGGNCCDGPAAPPPPGSSSAQRVMMISSDDLRARLKARKT